MRYDFPASLQRMVHERMAAGKYESEDDLLEDALIALDEVMQRATELRTEIRQRVSKSGTDLSQPLNWSEFRAEARRRLKNEH